ncbi:MAG: hypothetical protein ABFE07_06125 [Armatimonadia bacterium]
MSSSDLLLGYLDELKLKRLGPDEPAGLCIASLPWPRAAAKPLALGNTPTYVQPLGQWPGEAEGSPRRLLLVADAENTPPEELSVTPPASPVTAHPSAEAELFAKCEEEGLMWERHLLRISWGGHSVGLAMGLRHDGEVHWWECCRMVVLEETPECLVVEMGGAIPRKGFGMTEMRQGQSYNNEFLHHHNWLNGRIYARLHSNGVCEVYAHHVNSKFFDDGEDLADVVPVVGIRYGDETADLNAHRGPWTGEQGLPELGGVRFDVSEAGRLATAGQPGHLDAADGFLVWQPYEGVDLYSGAWARTTTGDPFLYHSTDRMFPRGMARTLRFSLSLSARSPRVARYVAPAWWYGVCEDFVPEPLLPVSNAYDQTLESCRKYCRDYIVKGGFEDGALPRHANPHPGPLDRGRSEAGWEGEAPWAMFLLAYLSGDTADYDNALRAAWSFTDIAIDHAAKLVRMHGFGHHAFAEPMNRLLGPITAYLETGVPYLLETSQAVVDNAHWLQKNSWPRLAVGRDAKYVRSAVMLYRYTADEHYRRIAHEGAMMVHHSQRPNGSFGDQAGGTGLHQWGAYITKPWMGLMATEGVLDYLELFPDDEALLSTVKRFADWLMAVRFRHDTGVKQFEAAGPKPPGEGVMGWGYQHDFNGQPRHFDAYSGKWWDLPYPKAMWHQNSLGRLLGYVAMRFNLPEYLDAWAESWAANRDGSGDHGVATSAHPLPWLQAKLWGARLQQDGVQLHPVHFGPRTEPEARLLTPEGPVAVRWENGKVVAEGGGRLV